MRWESYVPAWLVEFVREAHPEMPWLAAALSNCTRAARESKAFIYFVDPANANDPGAEWQFHENVLLTHPTEGDLVLDILRDRRVGGIEFLKSR